MNNQNMFNSEGRNLPFPKVANQQVPISPFKLASNNEQGPSTARPPLAEPQSPFARVENNNNIFMRKQPDSNLKISTLGNATSGVGAPISPFNMTNPNRNLPGPKVPQPLASKGNKIFSTQVDMPIIPQADTYNQSITATTTSKNTATPQFYETKRELNMSNINSMVSNIKKGQESNVIDKILFDTQYSGMVDSKYDNELVRHNCKNDKLYKCFSRSSSGMFSFKSPDAYPNEKTIYYIDVGNEIGTTSLRMNENKKTQDNMYQNKHPNTNNPPHMNEKEKMGPAMKGQKTANPQANNASQNNNIKITSTFSYDNEYLLWRDVLMDILKNSNTESDYGNRINAYYKNINNESQNDYTLRMPMELLTLLNTKIK